ncbi:MAG: BREX-1 system phosphatase PglZ type B [Opitutales bacterium]|nr:BREX-1 system phosphatase PglZ type B [Opitutales bacterium]
MALIINELIRAVRAAAVFNAQIQVPPACILWPDKERQWEAIIPRLQEEMPELCVLGKYDAGSRRGPAIWLRAALVGHCLEKADPAFTQAVEEAQNAYHKTGTTPHPPIPIIYLPGVGRQDLRAVESCPEELKPLAELQYRGCLWSQINAKDWTILAFLKSDQGGLGLDVAQDADAKRAMQLSLYRLIDEEVDLLRGKRLDRDFFNRLLTSGDPTRDLLQWIDQGDAFTKSMGETEWQAFVEVTRSQMGFDPGKEGQLSAAEKLAGHEGPWSPVWQRYMEAPTRYPLIAGLIERCPIPNDLFADPSGWPQLNASKEQDLEAALKKIASLSPHEARKRVLELDREHGERRSWVWTQLGQSPLALAIGELAVVARISEQSLGVPSLEDMVAIYRTSGWQADWAALQASKLVTKGGPLEAVQGTLQAIYLPWLEEGARKLQALVTQRGYPGSKADTPPFPDAEAGMIVFFVDGLRFDLAQKLAERLGQKPVTVDRQPAWSALPSVTATAKPAVSPVREEIIGENVSADFDPVVKATGKSLKGGHHFKKLLLDQGWQFLTAHETGDPNGKAWTQTGDIDAEGHADVGKFARNLEGLLEDIEERIQQLLEAGWKRIELVTDHGFLALPGGLPTTKLNSNLSENTWGRCAALKPGAKSEEAHYSWFWNPVHSFALAGGVNCYGRSREYTHGGLSLQECLTERFTLRPANTLGSSIQVTNTVWRGMRLTVEIEGADTDLRLDVRQHAGDASSSLARQIKSFKDGKASVVVEDDSLIDTKAYTLVLGENDELLAQFETRIGDT